jgi:hypothetical protein
MSILRSSQIDCAEQRADGKSIRDTDISVWVNSPVSWGYQTLLDRATKRFNEFIKIMGPKHSRSHAVSGFASIILYVIFIPHNSNVICDLL